MGVLGHLRLVAIEGWTGGKRQRWTQTWHPGPGWTPPRRASKLGALGEVACETLSLTTGACSAWLGREKPGGGQEPKPSSHHLDTTGVKGNTRHRCSCTKHRLWKPTCLHLWDASLKCNLKVQPPPQKMQVPAEKHLLTLTQINHNQPYTQTHSTKYTHIYIYTRLLSPIPNSKFQKGLKTSRFL